MFSKAHLKLVVAMIFLAPAVCTIVAPPMPGARGMSGVLTTRVELISNAEGFFLKFPPPENLKLLPVPKEWLVSPEDEATAEESYVSPNKFDPHVPSFYIGDGRLGLHLSSFDSMKEGSAQAAAGRDVFLLYDPEQSKLSKGLMDLGITKERVRVMGCFSAKATHFLLGDINRDGLQDLGAIREEVKCEGQDDSMRGPFYEQAPVAWYVLGQNGWQLDEAFSGRFPDRFSALHLVGMSLTPVDYVAHRLWKTYDPYQWPGRAHHTAARLELFVPHYRSELIKRERSGSSH